MTPLRLARSAGVAIGGAAWGAYHLRVLLRALHMLQLEGYLTGRFLRWSLQQPDRWARRDQAALALVAALLGVADLTRGGQARGPAPTPPRASNWLVPLAWAALGAWLWQRAQPGPAKKPLVLTARARRLLAGQIVVDLAAVIGPAAALWLRGGRAREAALPALRAGASGLSLAAPLVTAVANLLLWPVEEAFRRYYLRDARRVLRRYAPTVIGVAGSYGKTSTKEFLATVLAARWSVLKPPGSYNTPMGLSRVIREQLEPSHELFVAELGDWVPGDIRFLCDLLEPRIGVLTAIGPEHLERFKTIQRVVESKAELIDALPPDGLAVVNQDDPLVRALGDRAEARGLRVVRYGQSEPGAHVRAGDVKTTRDGLSFTVSADGHGHVAFQVGLLGRHNVANVLAATAVALELGMSLAEIADAAGRIRPVEHRLQPIKAEGGVLVIDDAFNSNPRGAAEALEVLAELEGRRRVLVTPGMIELAEREFDENRAFGRKAAAVCDEVILVGPDRARPMLAGLRDGGFPAERTQVVRDLAEATARLRGLLAPGDIVLFENDLPDQYEERPDTVQRAATSGAGQVAAGDRVDRVTGKLAVSPLEGGARPAPATTQSFIHVEGLRVAYSERRTGTGETPVVVLHGWGASSAAVASIVRCLEGEYHVIAPDLPGFGASDPPPRAWGSGEYAALVRAFLGQLGIERASFIGHSLGGKIGIVLAATTPDLVERLVLVNSAGIRPRRGPEHRARVLAFKAARRAGQLLPLGKRYEHWVRGRFGSDDYRQAGTLRGTLVRLVNEDLRPLLPRVEAPTLLIWGELDDATPLADGQLMERLIPDAGLVVFPGAGHFAYADDPGRFCRVVSHFLNA